MQRTLTIRPRPRSSAGSGCSAFTLVEILVVITIILILSGIVVGVAGGVSSKQARSKAEAELQTIAAALESYKLKYGGYPPGGSGGNTDAQGGLVAHLTGEKKIVPDGQGGVSIEDAYSAEANRRPFLDEEAFSVVGSGDDRRIVDPWGQPYVYLYQYGTGWRRVGFILYSKGPDGQPGTPSTEVSQGEIPKAYFDDDDNVDNLVYGFEL